MFNPNPSNPMFPPSCGAAVGSCVRRMTVVFPTGVAVRIMGATDPGAALVIASPIHGGLV
jgi:hypothetical protein